MSTDKDTLAAYAAKIDDYVRMTDEAPDDPQLAAFIGALPSGAHVLDLGCGPGWAAAQMAAAGLTVTAGGSVTAAFPKARTEAQIGDLLHDPELRARWQRCALLTGGKVLI